MRLQGTKNNAEGVGIQKSSILANRYHSIFILFVYL